MLELEAQVFQFRLYLIEAQAVGQWCVDIEGLSCYLVLLVGWLRVQGPHVVQTVAYLDEDDSYVVAHGEQQLLEVFCLCRSLLSEDAATDLRQSVNNLCYLGSEDVLDVLYGVVCVFHHIVEQCRTDAGRAESDLSAGYLSHGDGVHDVGLAGKSAHTLVSLTGKVECLCDQVHLLAVA